VPHLQEKFLIFLRLVIRIRPRKELIGVILEMHRDLTEDAPAQIDSVVKILCGGENDLGLLDIAGIKIYRAFRGLKERRHFLLEPIRFPLDFWQLIRFNKPLEREKYAIDDVAHFGLVIIREIERNDRRPMVDDAVGGQKALLDFGNEPGVRNKNADEEFD